MSFNRNTDVILSATNQLLMLVLCIKMLPYFLLRISARVVAIFVELCIFLRVRENAISSIKLFYKIFDTKTARSAYISRWHLVLHIKSHRS